ncbi:MAG TPA: hypothetical protein VLZ81_08960 [Blastocatellia bacterium]|nr:hypothetical protein [Blastocatellia bacterium]
MRKKMQMIVIVLASALIGGGAVAAMKASPRPVATPETVLSVFHVKEGSEEAFLKTARDTWATYREMDGVFPSPHLLMKGTDESGKTCYFEVFTWRDAEIPDHAPDKVKAHWKELESLCEQRSGRRGIEINPVQIVDEAK